MGVGAAGNVILSSVNGSIVSTATGVDTIKGGTGVQLDALNGTLGTAAAPLSIATPVFEFLWAHRVATLALDGIGTVVLLAQTRHVRQTDLGYARDGLVTVLSMRDTLVTPERRRAVTENSRSRL